MWDRKVNYKYIEDRWLLQIKHLDKEAITEGGTREHSLVNSMKSVIEIQDHRKDNSQKGMPKASLQVGMLCFLI